jgi:hypothetical protein
MYGLPKDFDCNCFVGHALEMICVNANQIYLHFDGKTVITIESKYAVRKKQDANILVSEVPFVETKLFSLIEQKIIAATAREDGTLTLAFGNDFLLSCYDRSDQYESYQIKLGDKTIIV